MRLKYLKPKQKKLIRDMQEKNALLVAVFDKRVMTITCTLSDGTNDYYDVPQYRFESLVDRKIISPDAVEEMCSLDVDVYKYGFTKEFKELNNK